MLQNVLLSESFFLHFSHLRLQRLTEQGYFTTQCTFSFLFSFFRGGATWVILNCKNNFHARGPFRPRPCSCRQEEVTGGFRGAAAGLTGSGRRVKTPSLVLARGSRCNLLLTLRRFVNTCHGCTAPHTHTVQCAHTHAHTPQCPDLSDLPFLQQVLQWNKEKRGFRF